jgi:hypothetical protein
VKLLCAMALAVFSVAAPVGSPAQSLDPSLLSALCSDDYYEDTTGQCEVISAEILTIEAIVAKYGVVITGDADEDAIVFLFEDPEDAPVGSILPRNKDAVSTDKKSNVEPADEQETITSRVIVLEAPSAIDGEDADDVATTGPTARTIPAPAEAVEDNRTIE